MRICIICDSLYLDDSDECKECKGGGELISVMKSYESDKDGKNNS